VLQVGIGHEADGGVESLMKGHVGYAIRVKRQAGLNHKDDQRPQEE